MHVKSLQKSPRPWPKEAVEVIRRLNPAAVWATTEARRRWSVDVLSTL